MRKKTTSKPPVEEDDSGDESPVMSPVDSDEYGSSEAESDDDSRSEDEFEDQGSSDDDDDRIDRQMNEDESDDEIMLKYENLRRNFKSSKRDRKDPKAELIHTDDLSSDEEDEDGEGNRIGRVPLHWYDEYDHIGYNAHGSKVEKSASNQGDSIDQRLANQDNMAAGKYVVHDALNDKNVELSARQLELIRRVQAGAYAHPEFEGEPDYIDYFSGVDPEISGLNSDRVEPKSRFQPSKWEKMQVQRLVERLEKGEITRDFLLGKEKKRQDDGPYMLWTGDEEDELANRKGPQHIAAPKLPPPGHAESYVPPDEYLPTEEEIKQWEEMEPKNRPHGLLIPKKFPNLRSVGAYKHSVQEAFERCLDLYLCPRIMKRKLNIDPESLVPRLPKASDLKPYPTAKCIEYITPHDGEEAPTVRCISPSPDGRFLASGASDGYLRLWEVESSRLLRSWNLSSLAEGEEGAVLPVIGVEWNPNRSHHCLLAAVGKCVVVVATGTAHDDDALLTDALLDIGKKGGRVTNEITRKAVTWSIVDGFSGDRTISSFDTNIGPMTVLKMTSDVSSVRWQAKGDYFVSVSPKAGAAAVLIHQLSKGNSQQPFKKAKGEAQIAAFHPNKPFLFVASQQHVRIYHLVKQTMVRRLITGCRWISSLDVHPSGDHLIVGSLDRRMIWFDLDLSATPYRTLKYHERALRASCFHRRYPLMASASDDGTVHVFHSMVYNDLMKNPLIVPVKILKGHAITKKLGVLSTRFHPTQPWLFSCGADGKIILFQDI